LPKMIEKPFWQLSFLGPFLPKKLVN
jgi:hypothetical protein